MSTDLVMRKRKGKLSTVDFVGDDALSGIPDDQDLLVTITRKPTRTLVQLRFVWSLADKVAKNFQHLDKDEALNVLCEMARHVDVVVNPITGHAHLIRRSISNLSIDAMSRLIDRMIFVTCDRIIPGLDEGTLRDELESMVAPNHERQREPA